MSPAELAALAAAARQAGDTVQVEGISVPVRKMESGRLVATVTHGTSSFTWSAKSMDILQSRIDINAKPSERMAMDGALQ